jgi:hypothetical protein
MSAPLLLLTALLSSATMSVASPVASEEDDCYCTKERFPVCGVDGYSYANRCLAKCADTVSNGH